MATMTRAQLLEFMRKTPHWVEATMSAASGPQAAVVGVAVSDDFELVFDTLDDTRKCQNLRRDPRVAFVMWAGDATVQVEGIADEPAGGELARVKALYFQQFLDGPTRESWPGIAYVRVRPRWLRFTDFAPGGPHLVVYDAEALAALR